MRDSMYIVAGDMYGQGWWDDAKSAFKHGVSAIQHNSVEWELAKKVVKSAKCLR